MHPTAPPPPQPSRRRRSPSDPTSAPRCGTRRHAIPLAPHDDRQDSPRTRRHTRSSTPLDDARQLGAADVILQTISRVLPTSRWSSRRAIAWRKRCAALTHPAPRPHTPHSHSATSARRRSRRDPANAPCTPRVVLELPERVRVGGRSAPSRHLERGQGAGVKVTARVGCPTLAYRIYMRVRLRCTERDGWLRVCTTCQRRIRTVTPQCESVDCGA